MFGGQKIIYGVGSLDTMWVPELKVGFSGLVSSASGEPSLPSLSFSAIFKCGKF